MQQDRYCPRCKGSCNSHVPRLRPQLASLTILPVDTDGFIPSQRKRPADQNKKRWAAKSNNHGSPDGP
jgi:hypothetical protein